MRIRLNLQLILSLWALLALLGLVACSGGNFAGGIDKQSPKSNDDDDDDDDDSSGLLDDDDDDDDDDNSITDDDGDGFKMREDLIITGATGDKMQDDNTIGVRYLSNASGDGEWQEVEWPEDGQEVKIPNVCLKSGAETLIELKVRGGKFSYISPPHQFLGKREGFGASLLIGFESSGTCGIFNTGILAKDCLDDAMARFSCPKADLKIQGVM